MLVPFASARALEAPANDVVLTVSGQIANTNASGAAEFDMAMLEAMPKHSFKTTSPWLPVSTFEGVKLATLLDTVGAKGTQIYAVALNDYAVKIPVSDAYENDALIAYKIDNEYMPVRKKGPLWVIYNFDGKPALRTEVFYTRAIWQLKAIKIE